jgi:hypothetical protein
LSRMARQTCDSSSAVILIGTLSMSSVGDILWNDSSNGSSDTVPDFPVEIGGHQIPRCLDLAPSAVDTDRSASGRQVAVAGTPATRRSAEFKLERLAQLRDLGPVDLRAPRPTGWR